ncbi:MAG: HPP family protein [Thermoprotei archaeon]
MHKPTSEWVSHSSLPWYCYLWLFTVLLPFALASGNAAIYLFPPFAATATIILFIPSANLAQPYPVIVGSTIGATLGDALSLFEHGPIWAALAAALSAFVMNAVKAYHPPGVALSLYPLLLRPPVSFPLTTVLPFTLLVTFSSAGLSRLLDRWPKYPSRPHPSMGNTSRQHGVPPLDRKSSPYEDVP